jgi:hypothetical protein
VLERAESIPDCFIFRRPNRDFPPFETLAYSDPPSRRSYRSARNWRWLR